jgi:hypothetical protein
LGIAIIAVGQEPVIDAVVGARRRRQCEGAVLAAEGNAPPVTLDYDVRARSLPAHQHPGGNGHEAERAPPRLPEAKPKAANRDQHERRAGDRRQDRDCAWPGRHPLACGQQKVDAEPHDLQWSGFEAEGHSQETEQRKRHDQQAHQRQGNQIGDDAVMDRRWKW